jgi:hypothetical protein
MAKLPTQPGVSRRQYALSRNVSEAAIRKHIANGTLAGAVLENGIIDPDAADKLLAGSVTRGPKLPVQVSTAKGRRQRAQVRLLHDEVTRDTPKCDQYPGCGAVPQWDATGPSRRLAARHTGQSGCRRRWPARRASPPRAR